MTPVDSIHLSTAVPSSSARETSESSATYSRQNGEPRADPCLTVMAHADRCVAALAHWCLVVGAWLAIAVALLVMSDVIGRAIFRYPIVGTVELARNTVVLIVFCQLPAAILEGKMLRVVALFNRMSSRKQMWIESVAAIAAAAIFFGLVTDNLAPMLRAFRMHEVDGVGSVTMPIGPVRAVLEVLWSISFLSALVVLARTLRGEIAASSAIH